MPEKKVQVILEGKDANLINALNRSEGRIRTWGNKTLNVFGRVGAGIGTFCDKNIRALETIGLGIGFTAMLKDMIEFDASLRKIGRTSGANAKEVQALREQILGLISPASRLKLPLTKGELTGIVRELSATGISLDRIREILPQIAKGAVASGLENKSAYGAALGELLDKYKVAAADLPALQDQINKAMKFEDVRKDPEGFLQALQGLSKTMQLIKSQGMTNVTPLIALQAQLTAFMGSAGGAAGSIDAIFDGLRRNKEKLLKLKSYGIEFYDNKKDIKNIHELLPELKKLGALLEKKGLGDEAVQMLFGGRGMEASKGLQAILMKYDEIIKKQEELKRSGGDMGKDFETEAQSMTNKLKLFQNQLDSFKVKHMAGGLEKLKSLLDYLNAHPIIAKGLMTAAAGAAGVILFEKVFTAGRSLFDVFSGRGKGQPGIAGGLPGLGRLGGGAGPVPVYVVNKHFSMLPGQGWGFPGGGKIPGVPPGAGGAGGVFRTAGKFIPPLLPMILSYEWMKSRRAEARGENDLVTPEPEWFSQKLNLPKLPEGSLRDAVNPASALNKINLTVNIDQKGRVTTVSDDTNTSIDVERGALLD